MVSHTLKVPFFLYCFYRKFNSLKCFYMFGEVNLTFYPTFVDIQTQICQICSLFSVEYPPIHLFQSQIASPQLNHMRQPGHFDYAVYLTKMSKSCLHITKSSAAGANSYIRSYTGACDCCERKTFNHLSYMVKIVPEKVLLNHCG